MANKQLNVLVTDETNALLKDMKQRRGTSHTVAIRRAVTMLDFVLDARDKGRRVCIVDSKGHIVQDIPVY